MTDYDIERIAEAADISEEFLRDMPEGDLEALAASIDALEEDDGDDGLEVRATDFKDEFLSGEAELRLRGERQAILGVINTISAGSEVLSRASDPQRLVLAAFGFEVLAQVERKGWSPEELERRVEERHVALEPEEIPDMLEVEIVEEDDGSSSN